MHPVYWGTMHTEEAWDMTGVTQKGEIAEVASTYAYLSTAYPCLNEKQLAIGETTIYGKRELITTQVSSLLKSLRESYCGRCTTAREAIKLIGTLAEQYGYGDMPNALQLPIKRRYGSWR